MRILKEISLYIVLSAILSFIAYCLKSDFLFEYLQNNIIGLLLTLLAINTATLGLIASKIQDVMIEYPTLDFSQSIKEMKISLFEQIVLIAVSIICMIFLKSTIIIFDCKDFIGNAILIAILIYSINILWDTGKAVFIVIEEIQKINKKK